MKYPTIVFNILFIIREISSLFNPCSEYLTYVIQRNTKYGIITIPEPSKGLTEIEVHVAIITAGPLYDYENFGGLELMKPLGDALTYGKRGNDIQFRLNFAQSDQWPVLTKITLNHTVFCIGPRFYDAVEFSFQQTIFIPNPIPDRSPKPSPPKPNPPSNSGPSDDASWVNSLPQAGICGRNSNFQSTHPIIGGVVIDRGEYPWLVALYHFVNKIPENNCAGSLVSNEYVVTAAHCLSDQESIYLEVGRYNLSDSNEVYEPRISLRLIRHPEYIAGEPNNDIALILIERVEFTSKIKPICLWSFGTKFDKFLTNGNITGWGRVENDGAFSNVPMKLKVKRVDQNTCKNSNQELARIVTAKTFCAGGQNAGPCHGDSGSGFYYFNDGIWYLRGIVSMSLGTNFVCNVQQYAVYADIAFHLDWLKPYLLS